MSGTGMKSADMKLQFKVCEYMEKTYGKKWSTRMTLSSSAITNAFIDGYREKEAEDKTASQVFFNRKLIDKMEEHKETFTEFFKLEIIVKDFMPEHLIAFVDDDMNVLSFIDLNKPGNNTQDK